MTESVQDDPGLEAVLVQDLAKIQEMATKHNEIVNEYRQHALNEDSSMRYTDTDTNTPRTTEFVNALKKYREHNQWPLCIAIHKMAIKLIMLLKLQRLPEVEYKYYKQRLLGLIPDNNSNYTALKNNMDIETKKSLFALIDNLNSLISLNAEVQKDLENADNEKLVSRLSVLMGKGGGKKSRKPHGKPLRKNTRKSKSNKAVAAAIKDIPLSKARADFAALKAIH
jgi:hypothetical protein